MNFQPLLEQIERLNRNLETWIGLVATANTRPADDASQSATPAPAPAPSEPPAEAGNETQGNKRGRPRKRYWFHSQNDWVQENTDSPGDAWVEVTKTKFEEIRARHAAAKTQAAPAPAAPAAATGTGSDDPFADDPPAAAPTIDDVRNAVFKVRDTYGMDRARGLISKYAEKMDKVKPEHYASLIADAKAALAGDDL